MRVIDPIAGYKILIGSPLYHFVFLLGTLWAYKGVLKSFSNRLNDNAPMKMYDDQYPTW